jgi:hypothetical protein
LSSKLSDAQGFAFSHFSAAQALWQMPPSLLGYDAAKSALAF